MNYRTNAKPSEEEKFYTVFVKVCFYGVEPVIMDWPEKLTKEEANGRMIRLLDEWKAMMDLPHAVKLLTMIVDPRKIAYVQVYKQEV